MDKIQSKRLILGDQIRLNEHIGTVVEKASGGLLIRWSDSETGWIDYRDFEDISIYKYRDQAL
jgi:hypothetical protein